MCGAGFVGVPGAAAGSCGVLCFAFFFGAGGGVFVEGDLDYFAVAGAVDV